jgi:hypothetical protein
MPDNKPKKITTKERKQLMVLEGLGKIRVLSVGVSDYFKKSGFKNLKQCLNDAFQVFSAFRDVKQLNTEETHLILMNSETKETLPSRGAILDQIHELASKAEKHDRILFYFSGHGHRIDGVDDHFLVPQDVFAADKPDALVSMKQVMEILNASDAKQKIIVLDACLSGPEVLSKKLVAAGYSEKFFAKYLAETKGVAVLSSSASDEKSYTQSDDPRLSLFTYYFIKALRGAPEAMDGQILTLPKLFDYVSTNVKRKGLDYRIQQTPSIETSSNATLVLADFRAPIVLPSSIDLKAHPLESVIFRETFGERTKSILTEWRDRTKTPEQLQFAANSVDAMGAYVKGDFGRWRPLLRKNFDFVSSDIGANGGTLTFPGGELTYYYRADSKDSGYIHRKLVLTVDWFGDRERLASLLEVFNFSPNSFALRLGMRLVPMDQVTGLEANGWKIETESDDTVVAIKDGITITVREGSLKFIGFDIPKLLASETDPTDDQVLLAETVAILAPSKDS